MNNDNPNMILVNEDGLDLILELAWMYTELADYPDSHGDVVLLDIIKGEA